MKKTLFTLTFLVVAIIHCPCCNSSELMSSVQCFSQTHSKAMEYRTFTNGKEMRIVLYSDSTYDFNTYWGAHHGLWEIHENKEDSLFDIIYFYDDVFTTKSATHFTHISLSDTAAEQTDSLDDSHTDFFVTMYDLTGEIVPYYQVCFLDSTGELIYCQYNPDKENKHFIPVNTKTIWMMGEHRNLNTYFKCNYSTDEGNIAFIIGPGVNRFYINKERDSIRYRPCYCESHTNNCSVVFNKHSN